jgi:hypothetical protein
MSDWKALRPAVVLALLLAACLAIIAGLVRVDSVAQITPGPEDVAAGFVGALGAHRYTGAREQLSDELRGQYSLTDLRDRMEELEARGVQIVDAQGQPPDVQGDRATAPVEVTLPGGEKIELTFPLRKDKGLWSLESMEPLFSLGR